jgi:hypothetical protein
VICSYRAQSNKEVRGDRGSRGELFDSPLQIRSIERSRHCNGFNMTTRARRTIAGVEWRWSAFICSKHGRSPRPPAILKTLGGRHVIRVPTERFSQARQDEVKIRPPR